MLERIVGNEKTKNDLAVAMAENRLAHSLLLCGEEGCGTGFVARCIAADRLWPKGGPSAEALMRGETSQVFTDSEGNGYTVTGVVREVFSARGEGRSGNIKVGAMRTLRQEMYNTALSGEGRAAILYDVQNLNASSGNALLKILEEPPEGALFILTAPSPAVVLPTIRSRCSLYTLSPVSNEDCAGWLKQHCPACKEPELYAQVFSGRIGRARQAAADPAAAARFEEARRLAEATAQREEYELLVAFSRWEKDRPALLGLLDDMLCLYDAAMNSSGLFGLSSRTAGRAIVRIQTAQKALNGFVNTRLVLTNLAIQLARCAD